MLTVALLPPDGETSAGYLVKYDFVGNSTTVFEYDNETEANTKRDELQAADDTRDYQVVKVN